MKLTFAPSVLSADFSRLGSQVQEAVDAGAEVIHFDVMDGHFVPNITFGPFVIEWVRPVSSVIYETHLMIEFPEKYIEDFAKAGSDRIFVHPETCPHLHRTLQQIRAAGAETGAAINPSTSLDSISWVMEELDSILIMTVNPGFGGQKFIAPMLKKIEKARKMIDECGRKIWLGVDGGINIETAPQVVNAGANLIIAGSSVFNKRKSVSENLSDLNASVLGAGVRI